MDDALPTSNVRKLIKARLAELSVDAQAADGKPARDVQVNKVRGAHASAKFGLALRAPRRVRPPATRAALPEGAPGGYRSAGLFWKRPGPVKANCRASDEAPVRDCNLARFVGVAPSGVPPSRAGPQVLLRPG